MSDRSYLHWPFLDDSHRQLAAEIDAWASEVQQTIIARQALAAFASESA